MEGKKCNCEFKYIRVAKVELMLMICKNKPPGVDNLDVKLLKPIASLIVPVITHIINQCFNKNVCPQAWKVSKEVPIPKSKKLPFTESNSQPKSVLPILSKIVEKLCMNRFSLTFPKIIESLNFNMHIEKNITTHCLVSNG